MAAKPEVIMIEFNELCPEFLRQYMDQGLIPNFRRLHESSRVLTTDAGEEPPNLEPWIQWVSVHSGMTYGEHQAFHLGDGRKLKQPLLAQLLSDAGIPVGVFSSMNTNYRGLKGYFIPDPWEVEGSASPDWLNTFYRTVANQVLESSRADSFTKKDMLKFGLFTLFHGLTFTTIMDILKQLWDERRDPGVKWRRASLAEHVSYDLFRYLNQRLSVRFATFFANSTAHYQHYFWRNQEPEKFQLKPAESDHPSLRSAILYGYQSMDRIIGRFLRDYPKSTLILCTALSQQTWDTTKCTFRPRSFESMLKFAGIDPNSAEVKPVMAEQFHLVFRSSEEAARAEERLRDLHVENILVMHVERKDKILFAGCRIIDATVNDKIMTRKSDSVSVPFKEMFYMIHSVRSGRHNPHGVLWIRDPKMLPEVVAEEVPLTIITPMVLKYFNVGLPSHLRSDRPEAAPSPL